MISYQMCQMNCYFEPDCHFVVSINSTICGVGNYKLAPLANFTDVNPVFVAVCKGNNEVMFYFYFS